MSDAYANVIPRKLKIKGQPLNEVSANGKKKIKKRKIQELEDDTEVRANKIQQIVVPSSKTEYEKKIDKVMKERESEKAKKLAMKSYREKIDDLNTKIGSQTEHYDIPKVGPG